ncbi:hypothetical protein HC931_23325 [Candidatus Gracilibacteria bacterium]|nr:hypothetical protein [Candidatus Gracilibacteria bacterium]NJM86172.1 hypothetical protein [Hydrococcus sp. RU_2_2]NJP19126.1 hypothetical protein [Hydrococcus sp. CRU_1_1]NJQ96534.1 hypothetical protein [Hydrococcus sp. CSU_1_8]
MAKRRARLTDSNDPLNLTDKVLAGFEQVSQSTSQQANKLNSQEDDLSTSQQANKLTSQEDDLSASQPSSATVKRSHEAEIGSRSPNPPLADKPESQESIKLTSQEADNSTSQLVNKLKLRKSTFQISEAVLARLDQLHLQLQLELGKANAPYKEEIVEFAIVQLLEQANSNRAQLIEALLKRHQERRL